MEIDDALIRKVAKVARLDLTDEEVKRFIPQFKEILEHFSVLRKADISGIEPIFHPVDIDGRQRPDDPQPVLDRAAALALTPHKQDAYFKGPKVMK